MQEADYRSRDILILKDDENDLTEEEQALKEYRLAMAALLPDAAGKDFK